VIRKSFHYVIGVYDLENVSGEGQLKLEGQGSIPQKRKKTVDRRSKNAQKTREHFFLAVSSNQFRINNLNFHKFFAQLKKLLQFWSVDHCVIVFSKTI
jgi:hypothetical protein